MPLRAWLNLEPIRIPMKFGIVTGMFLIAALVPTALWVRSQNRALARIQQEAQGVAFLKVLYRLADHAAEAVLEARNFQDGAARADDNGPPLENLTASVEADLTALGAVEARVGRAIGAQAQAAALAGHWSAVDKLKEPTAQLAGMAAFLGRIQDVNARVVDSAGLSLDTDLTCTYLILVAAVELPQLAVQALDLSGQAQQALSGPGLATEGRRGLQAMAGALQGRLDNIRDDLTRGRGFSDPDVARRLAALQTEHRQVSEAFLEQVSTGVLGGKPTAGLPAVRFAGREAVRGAYGFQAAALKVLEDHLARRVRANRWELRLGLGVSLSAACLAFLLLASVYRGLRGGLEAMRSSLGALKDGDLTRTVQVPTRDELGGLAQDLNQTLASLRTLVATVQEAARGIRTATEDLAGRGEQLAQAIASHAEGLDRIAARVEALTTAATRTGTQAGDACAGALRLQEGLRDCQGAAVKATQAIGALKASTSQVARITDGVDEVAFQARLLALEAVEMAAEGDRRWPRLASGVHGLGHRSGQAAQLLKAMLRDHGTHLQAGGDRLAQAGAAVRQAAQDLQGLTAFLQGVALAARDQAGQFEEISWTLTRLGTRTDAFAAQVSEAKALAENLAGQARSLTGQVERFKV